MIVIYHNPDSQDSNACIEILETSKHNHQVIKYQDKPLDEEKLEKIINLLKISPIELIRTGEKLWVEKFKHLMESGIEFTNGELIDIMISHPELIERPIIINGEKAVIGKPPKKIFDILK
ncbi:arsenate reductase [Lacinutrix neustonica]|uniref:Arsenate reductase n=1 Tax=Lacinutrix neustonica TaxID=2980107 RepID=A0A9E8MVW2_9FLAO|nr:ArsC/Spx/MgsR family protein [Lacinutrix neustonica]WAC02587.1 arsenate reductase [Lacinutrix neustonica]